MDMVGLKLSRYHIIISKSSASSKEWQLWNIKQPTTHKQTKTAIFDHFSHKSHSWLNVVSFHINSDGYHDYCYPSSLALYTPLMPTWVNSLSNNNIIIIVLYFPWRWWDITLTELRWSTKLIDCPLDDAPPSTATIHRRVNKLIEVMDGIKQHE